MSHIRSPKSDTESHSEAGGLQSMPIHTAKEFISAKDQSNFM